MPSPDPPARRALGLWALVAVQLLLLAAYVLIDFGWREPGPLGLTVVEQLLIGLAYLVLLVGGIGGALWRRAWAPLAVQALVALAALAWSMDPGIPLVRRTTRTSSAKPRPR